MDSVGSTSSAPMAFPRWKEVAELDYYNSFFLNDDLIFSVSKNEPIISLIDMITGDKVREFRVYDSPGLALTLLAPNKRELFVTHEQSNQQAAIWDVTTGTKLYDLPSTLNGKAIYPDHFYPIPTSCITIDAKCSICFRQAQLHLTFSPDSTKILSLCSLCFHLTIYDKISLEKISSWLLDIKRYEWRFSLIPLPHEQKILITGINYVRLFDLETGLASILNINFEPAYALVAFDASGTHLVVVSEDYINQVDLQSLEIKGRPRKSTPEKTVKSVFYFQNYLRIVEFSHISENPSLSFREIDLATFFQENQDLPQEKTLESFLSPQTIDEVLFSQDRFKVMIQPECKKGERTLWINVHELFLRELDLIALAITVAECTIPCQVLEIVQENALLTARRRGWPGLKDTTE